MRFILLALLSIIYQVSNAITLPRVAGALGFSNSSVTSADAAGTRREGPIGFAFTIDYSYRHSYYVFAEHMRSAEGASTGVGLTGLGLKFYPWLSPEHFKSANTNKIDYTAIQRSGFAVYFAASSGFAQASIPSKSNENLNSALAAGLYVNAKSGLEYAMSSRWGLKTEGNFSVMVLGAGGISNVNLIFGTYFDL